MPEEYSVNGIKSSDPHAKTYLAIWFFFKVGADQVLLPILVATFLLSKSVKRNPTLINMCIAWIVTGISSSLLLYAGKESGPEPGRALCILQASLLEGVPPMCSLSALAFVYTIWASLSCISRDRDSRTTRFLTYALLIIPYVTLFGFALATSLVALQDPRKVDRSRRFFYCSVENNHLSNTMGVFSATICLICLFFEILIAVQIIRTWRAFRLYKNDVHRNGFEKHLIIRLFVFSGYLLTGLIFNAASVPSLKSVVPDLFAASIGMAAFLVFGTQSDVLRVWAFWLPARPPPVPPKDAISSRSLPHDFPSRKIPFREDHTATMLSDTETLREPTHVHHLHEEEIGMPTPSGYVTPASRASLTSRKGDSVIIINKPEETFVPVGGDKHDSA